MKKNEPTTGMRPFKVGIVGTFIRDTIVPLSGEKVESIGGLYHTSAYLAHLLDEGALRVRPLCHVGADFYDTVCEALDRFPGFELTYVKRLPMANTRVRLIYRSRDTRDEITSAPMPPVTKDEIPVLNECDAVLINLITGIDIEVSALRSLRQRSQALIYLDLHSLALGIDTNGKRYYRAVPAWRQWIEAIDILQVNEREAATLAGLGDHFTVEQLESFARQIVEEGLSICNITLAAQGSLLVYREGSAARVVYCPALEVSPTVDIIGCGDAFGAAFVAKYLAEGDAARAAYFANRVAGLNCTFMGSLTAERFRHHIEPHLRNHTHHDHATAA